MTMEDLDLIQRKLVATSEMILREMPDANSAKRKRLNTALQAVEVARGGVRILRTDLERLRSVMQELRSEGVLKRAE